MNVSTKDRVSELIRDLEESAHTRTQNFESLAHANGKKITTYCALGAIGCVKRMIYFDEMADNMVHEPEYDSIVNVYGISDRLIRPVPITYIDNDDDELMCTINSSLTNIITTLNDEAHYSFDQIGSFLRMLNNLGVFQKCTSKQRIKAKKLQLEEDIGIPLITNTNIHA